jgi:hypothetical protein
MAWFNMDLFSKKETPHLLADRNLEFEADKTGMIHVRKHPGQNKVLPGYGTTNFGISPFEPKKTMTPGRILLAGLASSGLLAWKFRTGIGSMLQTFSTYALLMRESKRN